MICGYEGHLPDGAYAGTPICRETVLAQGALDIGRKVRTNPLRWQGQFSPQLVEVLLTGCVGESPGGAVVADPFAGSGTVFLEGARKGFRVFGTDINPGAFNLARFYELAMSGPPARTQLEARVADTVYPYEGRPGWFDRLLDQWHTLAEGGEQHQELGILLGTLITMTPPSEGALLGKNREKLTRLLRQLPLAERGAVTVRLGDARNTGLPDGSVDLVLTSPPYINVYNYHQKYRASVEAMGWKVLPIAQSEIGSNRKHRGNRVLTVVQYCLDMAGALSEMRRILKREGRAVIVIGRESRVSGTAFYNGELVAEVATTVSGLGLVRRQERSFRNRFGKRIREDILHLSPAGGCAPEDKATERARQVAGRVLNGALRSCPGESRKAIADALEKADEVRMSPVFRWDPDVHVRRNPVGVFDSGGEPA